MNRNNDRRIRFVVGQSAKILVASLVCTVVLSHLAHAQALNPRAAAVVPPRFLTPPDSLTDISSYRESIQLLCPNSDPEDRGQLLDAELRMEALARSDDATVDIWDSLGCVRASLDLAGAFGREGLLMALGSSWQEGATRVLLEALRLSAKDRLAAELLAVVALDQGFPSRETEVRAALHNAVAVGNANPVTVRACALLTLRVGDLEASNACTQVGLAQGSDSTWQLIQLARLASHDADTAQVMEAFANAIRAAHTKAAWSEVGWHLRWFTQPEEWDEWESLADSSRAGWIGDRLASRDIRDGKPPGSRLVEHFTRLDYAEKHYRRNLPRRLYGMLNVAARPEDVGPGDRPSEPDGARFSSAPEYVGAQPFRFYRPWSRFLDDRGAIWLRFGKPTKLVKWKSTIAGNFNTREAWRYDLDGGHLLLQFEGEYFDNTQEATRLVAGVLGHYLCGLDALRCHDVLSLACWDNPGGCLGGESPVSKFELDRLNDADQLAINSATTRDDNSDPVDHSITTVGQLLRIWDPKNGAPLAVVPYAVRLDDLELKQDGNNSIAHLKLTLRQWSSQSGEWLDTEFSRQLRVPKKVSGADYLTGYSVTPSAPDVSAWSLIIEQGPGDRGRAWADHVSAIPRVSLAMSDLILGTAKQGEIWHTASGLLVPLGPLGAFDRSDPINLYWQVKSSVARPSVTTRVSVYRVGHIEEKAEFEVSFSERLVRGIDEIQRQIDVARLDAGEYRLEVVIRDSDTGAEARSSTRLLLH